MDANADQKKQALDHFGAGKQAMDAKDWERAATELRASLDVVDSPNARLELARALRGADKLADAWAEYGRVIESATKLAAKEDRYARTADAATTERGELEAKLAFVTVAVASAPAEATLKVGGRSIPSDQWVSPIAVPPGAVDVVLSDAGGKELARATVSAAVGQKTSVSIDANAASAAKGTGDTNTGDDNKPGAEEPKAEAPPASAPFDKTKLRPFSYVAGGVGVAGLATFAIFGAMSNSTYNDLKTACPAATGGCPPGQQDKISSGKTQQTVANVGLVLGLVGVAAGATLFVLSLPPKAPVANAAVVVGPGFLGLKGSL
jgi:hypothetical protein